MAIDLDDLSLTEMVQLQNQISVELKRRFEKRQALIFSDVVGSTSYFARFGDEAGRGLQQRHIDVLQQVVAAGGGRVFDVAGDGAFSIFPVADSATTAMVQLQERVSQQNGSLPREHQLSLRVALHWGPVLTDGQLVTGDAVHLCARVAATCEPGEVRLTRAAFLELGKESRARCHGLNPVPLKGSLEPVELLRLEWRDQGRFPTRVRVRETGEIINLPANDTITFGRLRDQNGIPANDIVLSLPDRALSQQISRWQFELRRRPEGFVLRAVSDQVTEVDGLPVAKHAEVPIQPGSVVRVAQVMTLEFLADAGSKPAGEATFYNI